MASRTERKGNKGEEQVIYTLAKIKEHHAVMNNFTYLDPRSEISHQIDHILIHPHGVFVIETKNYFGKISSDTDDVFWIKEIKGKKTIISNPTFQNKSHVSLINKLLDKKYDVISVIVYARNNAPYVEDYNVINLSDLLLLIDSYPYKKILTNEEVDKIEEKLASLQCKVSKKEHLKSIKKVKERKKSIQADMRMAIEQRKCPKCGGTIVVNGNTFSCTRCKYKFTL